MIIYASEDYSTQIRDHIPGLPADQPEQIARAESFVQGAVYCWCVSRPNEEFAVVHLFGNENKNWQDTPLQVIYDNLAAENEDTARNNARHSVGWLLKKVLHYDTRRTFLLTKRDLHVRGINHYQWLSEAGS